MQVKVSLRRLMEEAKLTVTAGGGGNRTPRPRPSFFLDKKVTVPGIEKTVTVPRTERVRTHKLRQESDIESNVVENST